MTGAAGCGDDSSPSEPSKASKASSSPKRSSSPSPSALGKAELRKALLTKKDFPSGWRTTSLGASDKAGGLDADDVECRRLLDTLSGDKAHAEADRDFEKSDSGPFVSQGVASYEKGGAKGALRDFKRLTSRCEGFTSKTGGTGSVTFTVAPMTLPAYGDESGALRFTGKAQGGPADGLSITMDLVLARVGPNTTGVAHMSVLGPDSKVTPGLMKKAVERMRAVTKG